MTPSVAELLANPYSFRILEAVLGATLIFLPRSVLFCFTIGKDTSLQTAGRFLQQCFISAVP